MHAQFLKTGSGRGQLAGPVFRLVSENLTAASFFPNQPKQRVFSAAKYICPPFSNWPRLSCPASDIRATDGIRSKPVHLRRPQPLQIPVLFGSMAVACSSFLVVMTALLVRTATMSNCGYRGDCNNCCQY